MDDKVEKKKREIKVAQKREEAKDTRELRGQGYSQDEKRYKTKSKRDGVRESRLHENSSLPYNSFQFSLLYKSFLNLSAISTLPRHNCFSSKLLRDDDDKKDAEVGDGTTSVVLLAREFLKLSKPFVEEGVHPQIINRAFRKATHLACDKIKKIAVSIGSCQPEEKRSLLMKCAATSLSSKLVSHQKDFFAKMVVDAVCMLDELLPIEMIGIKKVSGGALEEYQAVVDAEWNILYQKLEKLHASGAKVVLSRAGKDQQDGGQYGDRTGRCGPRINKSYTSSSISSQSSLRENSPLSRQQSLKAASQSVQSVADLSSTPLGNYSDVVAKKHLAGGSVHGHQGHHPTTSNPSGNTPVTNVNGFKHHNVPEQAPVQSNEWKDSKTHHSSTIGAGSYGGSGGHQQQSGEVGGSHHHHFQPPAYHKDVTIADKIKDSRKFQLADMPHNQSTSQQQQQQQQPAVQKVISSVESQHVQTPPSAIQTSSECGAPISSNTPTSSKTPTLSSGLLAADSEGNIEKKKEVTYTLNPNANEFRPRNTPSVSLEAGMGQILHPMVPAASLLPQQSTTQAHLQSLKPAHMANNQIGSQQTQQLVPSTVASPPILNPYPTGIQQFVMAPHPPIFYCQQPMTPRYSGGTKRATVSARGNNEVGTPQATNIMAGAPLISQNGLPAHMFVTPQQMLSPYNSPCLMTPCPVVLERVRIFHFTPTASLSLQVHAPQQIPSGSQMNFSPFIPTFPNHLSQSGGFTAAMPPPAIPGMLQGQVPTGSALHHHHLVQHQVAAAAQLGQFVAVPVLMAADRARLAPEDRPQFTTSQNIRGSSGLRSSSLPF